MRERDKIPHCGGVSYSSDGAQQPAPDVAAAPNSFSPGTLYYLDLEPLPTDEEGNVDPDVPLPPVIMPFKNEALWAYATCPTGGALFNTLWIYVQADQFEGTTQNAANLAAEQYYSEYLAGFLNCSPLVSHPVVGVQQYQMLPFEFQDIAGFWFSDPIENAPDGITIFAP